MTPRALLAAVCLGGALVILADATDNLAAGLGLLVLAGALAGIRPLAGIRLTRLWRRNGRRPPDDAR